MEGKLIKTLIVIIFISTVINESKQNYLISVLDEYKITSKYQTKSSENSIYEDYKFGSEAFPNSLLKQYRKRACDMQGYKFETERMPDEDLLEETIYVPIDYEALRETHEILDENICENYYSIYDDPWLCEQLADIVEITEDFNQNFNQNDYIEYFLFDFNDDGIDEYLISCNGFGWSGSSGNLVKIYQKNENDMLEQIYQVTTELYDYRGGYWPIAVLNEKTNGYYDFVISWTNNHIWKYDVERQQYVFE